MSNEGKIEKLMALIDEVAEQDPDRAARFIESVLARHALRKRLADKRVTQQPLTQPESYKLVPVERSYDMRVQAILHFNTAKKNGADLDDCMDAAWRATLEAAHGATGSKT